MVLVDTATESQVCHYMSLVWMGHLSNDEDHGVFIPLCFVEGLL